MKKKALLIGNYLNAFYHPLGQVEAMFKEIYQDIAEITTTEDFDVLTSPKMLEYDFCISYADCWEEKLSQAQVSGLINFVNSGRGLIVIHNGISFQQNYEFAQMVGARFTGHPPYCNLKFSVINTRHPITQGIIAFEMEEEPYRFEFDSFSKKTVLVSYLFENKEYPAVWVNSYGLGKVVYLMPGHDPKSFNHPVYRELLVNSAEWVI